MPEGSAVAAVGHSRPLLIFPCNGNGIEALDGLGDAWHCVGFIDDTPAHQAQGCMGISVYGRAALEHAPDAAVLAVPGGPASFRSRRAVIDGLGLDESRFATVIHPSAVVSRNARIGHNVLIMAGVVITSNAVIGDHVCVLPNSVIHHDSVVGSWSLIGSNVTIAGAVQIGEGCYVASGSTVKNGLRLGAGCLVGMGSNVLSDVAPTSTVVGNPARLVKK
jgi:sugar O-acyltransferase (sialic acid O-acetyltransferase NeuD family)